MKKKTNCYQQLQQEFKLVEEWKMDDQVEMQYEKLFNSLRAQNTKKRSVRDKRKLQRMSLHRGGSKLREISSRKRLQQSLSQQQPCSSNICGANFIQKKTIIEFQKQALMKEIDSLGKIVKRMTQDKIIAKQELRLLSNKQAECVSIINQLSGVLVQLQTSINEQKLANKQLSSSHSTRISNLRKQLQTVKDHNITQSTRYQYAQQFNVQHHTIVFLGTILHWTSQQNKIKLMQKKIYTKSQMETMLRAMYIVGRLAGLNYGNIIEHLIKIAQSTKRIGSDRNGFMVRREGCNGSNGVKRCDGSDQMEVYTDVFGNELTIKELIQRIDTQLLSKVQLRLLSKQQIIQYYAKQGISLSSSHPSATSTPNLSTPTQQMISKIVHHHEKLTSWFSRIEKRNQQLSQCYRSLLKVDDDLQKQITTMEMSSQQKSINYLQFREGQISRLEDRLRNECKVIFTFNVKMYNLNKRFTSLNKFFDKLVKQAEVRSKRYKKTYVGSEIDQSFLKSITKTLLKSPQNIILDWNKVIKNNKMVDSTKTATNRMSSTSDALETTSQTDAYYDAIMRNDLLRIYAQPSMYDSEKSYLENLQSTFEYVMGEECVIMERLAGILKGLLMFAKEGIEETGRENFLKESVEMTTRTQNTIDTKVSKQQQETLTRLSPLLRLFKQSKTQPRLDKFFHKDAVKQQSNQTEHESDNQEKENQHYFQKQTEQNNEQQTQLKQDNLCVESNEYYRRDDFKVIERLERLNMKKKGLLPKVPFSNDTTLEMELQQKKPQEVHAQTQKEFFRPGTTKTTFRNISPRLSHPRLSTCNHMLSERRERQCTRKRELNQLLANISTISLQNQKYRIKRKTNLTETMLSSSLSMSRLSYRGIK